MKTVCSRPPWSSLILNESWMSVNTPESKQNKNKRSDFRMNEALFLSDLHEYFMADSIVTHYFPLWRWFNISFQLDICVVLFLVFWSGKAFNSVWIIHSQRQKAHNNLNEPPNKSYCATSSSFNMLKLRRRCCWLVYDIFSLMVICVITISAWARK